MTSRLSGGLRAAAAAAAPAPAAGTSTRGSSTDVFLVDLQINKDKD